MKNSKFKKRFFRNDSIEQANRINLKKRKGISLWMIVLSILAGGLPIYLYLIVSGQMFEFAIIKKFFNSPEPIVSYKPIVNSKPDDSLPGNIISKRKLKNSKSSGLSKGLSGMNFLKNVNYQIDHHRKVIKWLQTLILLRKIAIEGKLHF